MGLARLLELINLFLKKRDQFASKEAAVRWPVLGVFIRQHQLYAVVDIPDLDDYLCNDKVYIFSYSENNLVGFFPNHWIRLHFVQIITVALSLAQSTLKKVARAVLSWASPLSNVSFPQ